MCTAISIKGLAGRNLDVTKSYNEEIIITPREYTLSYRKANNENHHFSFIGMGTVERGYPLYFDAANEKGLYMAGLNYVGNAHYFTSKEGYINLAPYELIPYILGKCQSISDAKRELRNINLVDVAFNRDMPNAELHWFISDGSSSLIIEPDEQGLNIYDNPVGVLTNNPSFPFQLFNLNNYIGLSASNPTFSFSKEISLNAYSEGMGGIGLPGDLSSASRFVRAVFHRLSSVSENTPSTLFHLLSTVEMPHGSVIANREYERTEFTSVVNLNTMTYYYRSYDGIGSGAVRLFSENIDANSLITYPVLKNIEAIYQN